MSISQDDALNLPKIEESSLVYNEFFKIQRDSLVLPNTHKYKYYTLITPGHAVNVLGITKDEQLVLLEEYRHPTGQFILGCPGGYLDKDEDPVKGAPRELLEESGYSARKFVLVGSAFPYPGISAQKIFFVVGIDAYRKAEPKPEPTEIIRTVLRTENEVRQAIKEGKPIDGILCTALYLWNAWKASN